MSRSRRKRKRGKCICGRSLVPFVEVIGQRKPRNPGCPHPVMDNVTAENERFLRFKAERRAMTVVERFDLGGEG